METAPDANNKKVVFQGKVIRERPAGDVGKKGRMKAAAKIAQEKSAAMNKVAASLAKRGLISDKAGAKIKSRAKN